MRNLGRAVLSGCLLCAAISGLHAAVQAKVPPTLREPSIEEETGVVISMRDGLHLVADVYRPSGPGRWPAILVRTPYNRRSDGTRGYRYFASRGYAVVIQDVRGRYASQGNFGFITQEGPDGNDTIDWIAHQPWSNGRVGMTGGSYLGMAQWWAAVQQNPHLATIFPLVSGDDEYLDRYYSPGGAMRLGHRLLWLSENLTPRGMLRPSFESYTEHVPLRNSDVAATLLKLDVWRKAVDHPSYDKYWSKLSIRQQLGKVSIPVCSMGGWFDNYCESDLDAFRTLSKRARPTEIWIGPWAHNFATKFPTRNFGMNADVSVRKLQLAWFDEYLKGSEPRPEHHHVLHLFVMGPDVWREEHEWPLARTRYTPFYLSSRGRANSLHGDGELHVEDVQHESLDTFTYDPRNPVPTMGGAICCTPKILLPGPLNQAAVEARADVLVYTTGPLHDDVEVTGPVSATLYVQTSANDTDFTAKLVDVFPDGRALLVTDGLQRLRYRISLSKPVFVKRNMPYQIRVDLGVTSYVFAPHHRIRLEISSSNFPRFDRNMNSDRANADETRFTVARQILFHDRRYPSVLILPIIPRMRTFSASLHSH